MHRVHDVIQELYVLLLVVFHDDMNELELVDRLNYVIDDVVFDVHLMLNNLLYVMGDQQMLLLVGKDHLSQFDDRKIINE
jgi:hypothetical protein